MQATNTVDGARLRVLVVDDEFLIRWSIVETLGAAGHTVVEAADARNARALLETADPVDAVVLDVRLPDSNDLTLLAEIRRAFPASPVFLMTAYGTPELADQARALGAVDVMNKPFEMQDLRRRIEGACRFNQGR
jgi:two-component system response regulator PilR (NtrC family)